MKKVKMTALILAATVTIGGYGLLGTSSLAITNNIVLASSVSTTSTTTSNGSAISRSSSSNVNGVATGEGVIINGGSSFELLSSPNGSKISSVSVGEMVTLESGNTNGYYKVEVRETGDIGYLKSCNIQEIYNCQKSSLENLSSQGTIINVSSVVNVRQRAGLNSDILTTMKNNETVSVIGKQGQWYKVSVNGETGFIYEEYISLNSNTVTTTAQKASTSGVTRNENVNSSASTSGATTNENVNSSAARSAKNNVISMAVVTNTAGNTSKTSGTVSNTGNTSKTSGTVSNTGNTSKTSGTVSNTGNTSKTSGTVSNIGNTSKTSGTVSNTGNTSKTSGTVSNTGNTSKTSGTVSNTGNTSKTSGTVSNTGNVTAQAVIQYAEQFEGYPYVWGGSSPSTGFDCSGFVQYVFNHFGISLPRTTYTQVNYGTDVPLSDIQPGDLVFEFGTATAPSHVGIYIGNGEMIDAAGVGQGVTISKLYDVVAVKNVL